MGIKFAVVICFILDYNSCASGPCKNGATCSNIPDHYQCTCSHDWSGKNCDVGKKINYNNS